MRDRELWLTALCYWILAVVLIQAFLWRRLGFSWLVLAALAVAAAPASVLLVIHERRTEAGRAREREALRAQGRFEEAAERASDATFTWGKAWGASYVAIGVLAAIVGIVLGLPVAILAGLSSCGWGASLFYRYSRWQRAELEHRRTSAARVAAAAEGLRRGNSDDRGPNGAARLPSASGDAGTR